MPNAGHKKNTPVTQNVGFHLKVYNTQFKAELPVSRNNPKWFLAPGLFESPFFANEYADKVYGVGTKRHIEGARVNLSIDPEVLAEIKAAEAEQRGGKRIVTPAAKDGAPSGGFKKNPAPIKKKVVEIIRKVTKRVATKANPS